MNKNPKRKILLNPGPSTTTDTVKYSQVVSDICPREEEFGHLMNSIRNDLLKIVSVDQKEYTTVLLGGSGTAAMESVLSSVISPKDKMLIIINGAYGKRLKQISETHNILFETLEYEWGQPIDLAKVESTLSNNKKIKFVSFVHHETTTGILNPLEKLQKLCDTYSKISIVDCISSFAGIPINLSETKVDFLLSTSNKCIQGMAGVSFVLCKKNTLEKAKNIPSKSFYLSLYDQYKSLEDKNQTRFTPPVQTIYALRQAIDEFLTEGSHSRYLRYCNNWETLRQGLEKIGFKFLLDSDNESKILTTLLEPKNAEYDFTKLHDLLYEDGFTIYPGKKTNERTFRLSVMGDINFTDIGFFLEALVRSLNKLGIENLEY